MPHSQISFLGEPFWEVASETSCREMHLLGSSLLSLLRASVLPVLCPMIPCAAANLVSSISSQINCRHQQLTSPDHRLLPPVFYKHFLRKPPLLLQCVSNQVQTPHLLFKTICVLRPTNCNHTSPLPSIPCPPPCLVFLYSPYTS